MNIPKSKSSKERVIPLNLIQGPAVNRGVAVMRSSSGGGLRRRELWGSSAMVVVVFDEDDSGQKGGCLRSEGVVVMEVKG